MTNERKTETIVRNALNKSGYFNNSNITVEEQKSDSQIVDKLLKNASKKGNGKGFPEFIIRSKEFPEFIIVIECKADPKKHESESRDKYSEFAVDGVLLYSAYLSKEFDVLAIAVSGQTLSEIRISQFMRLKNSDESKPILGREILTFGECYEAIIQSEEKFNQDYYRLLEYTKDLNDILHGKKIKESQRGLLISGVLIALQNRAFRGSFTAHKKPEQIANNLLSTIVDEFTNANLNAENINNLKQAYSFITTHSS